jgi:hypothetical protein
VVDKDSPMKKNMIDKINNTLGYVIVKIKTPPNHILSFSGVNTNSITVISLGLGN